MIDADDKLHDPNHMERSVLESYTKSVNRNIQSIVAYTKETRRIVRELEEIIKKLRAENSQKDEQLQSLNVRIAHLQAKYAAGGTSN